MRKSGDPGNTRFTRIPRFAFSPRGIAVIVGATIGCRDSLPAGSPQVSFQTVDTVPHFGTVSVAPLPRAALDRLRRLRGDQWNSVFSVHAGDTTGVPMLGDYRVDADTLRFVPQFPPLRGTRYVARFNGASFDLPAVTAEWTRTAATGPRTTRVTAVYPSADTLPMNLLRMYIQFSAPMTVGEATRRVRLLDAAGREVPNAFLVAAGGQELWDGAHERMTVFFDPGRIKRDLVPHEALGLPLRTGRSYSFIVDSAWPDATGRPLAERFVKRFYVGAMDRTLPQTASWGIAAPARGTRAALIVDFPEPLDRALAARMIAVKRGAVRINGVVSVESRETRWTFTPAEPWRDEDYLIEVDTELEDLAGNNLKHLFDMMPGDTGSYGVTGSVARIAFRPRP
jgi:hypothetical protein